MTVTGRSPPIGPVMLPPAPLEEEVEVTSPPLPVAELPPLPELALEVEDEPTAALVNVSPPHAPRSPSAVIPHASPRRPSMRPSIAEGLAARPNPRLDHGPSGEVCGDLVVY